MLDRFPTDSCILDVGLRGSCCWATPQPRNLSLRDVNTRTLCTWEPSWRRKAELSVWVGAILVVTCRTAHGARVWCKAGESSTYLYRETRRPHSSHTKVRTQIFILARNQARRHRMYSGNYPEHSSLPRMHETQKPSVRQGLTNPTISLIGFDD